GNGSGNLPGKDLAEELVEVGDFDGDDGVAGCLERGDGGVLRGVGGAGVLDVGEDAIVAIGRGIGDGFAVDGGDAFAELAGGLGDELLKPCAEVVNLR